MVPKSSSATQTKPSVPKSQERPTSTAKPSQGKSSDLAPAEPPRMSLIREGLNKYALSPAAKDVLMASWREGTSKQYHTYLGKRNQYCRDKNIDVFQPGVTNGIEFLVSLYKSGLGYSAINTARSALSSILVLEDGVKFGEHPLVARCMKGIFELKPALPKYTEIWNVNIVLGYLRAAAPLRSLSLKQLTLNLLLCLTMGQCGQTIHNFDVNYIQEMDDRYRITICEKLKQSKPGRHLAPIDLLSSPSDKKLCVVEHLKEYLQRTKQLREEHSQLLISYVKPFKPVSKDTISRWVKQVLESAGIDINKYSAHSSRAASTSSCKAKGLSLAVIMNSAGWSNSSTFAKFYDKPIDTASANFGSVLLNSNTL